MLQLFLWMNETLWMSHKLSFYSSGVYLPARQYFKIIAIIHTFCQQNRLPLLNGAIFCYLYVSFCLFRIFSLFLTLALALLIVLILAPVYASTPALFLTHINTYFSLKFIYDTKWRLFPSYTFQFILFFHLFCKLFYAFNWKRIRCVRSKTFCHIVADTKFNAVHIMPLTSVRIIYFSFYIFCKS